MRKLLTFIVTVAVTTLTVFAGALPASAHNALISSNPGEGDSLDTAPTEVVLTFDQPVEDADVNEVAVTGPNGDQWAKGTVKVDGDTVTAPLRPLGPAGEYIIGFRVLSADGHPVSDEIRFTLTEPGPGQASAAPDSANQGAGEKAEAEQSGQAQQDAAGEEDSSGVPVWVWLAGAAVLLVAGLAVALRMGRS
ncbi:copper resistance CopC family protein [Saccharomonospora xinjiangensis]|uniref:copper resistance CopC family protein n=1 Tax=Saccharomonospora xinjiangensis TaxID=75294 RepID=UPI00106F2A10|nr:copper resistance CopC family protein [Saccharomonospora xinjiangensis]QBQ58461.1 Copper transport protein YcnJ precursor [Saccharomonospora xinjiangensis]